MCNGWEMTFEDRLVDINDDDIGKWISMFYCDGFQLGSVHNKAKDGETPHHRLYNVCRDRYG